MNNLLIDSNIFSNNLNELMGERNFTQQDIADRTGISQATISRYLKPSCSPSKTNVMSLSVLFYVNLPWLCRGSGRKYVVGYNPLDPNEPGKTYIDERERVRSLKLNPEDEIYIDQVAEIFSSGDIGIAAALKANITQFHEAVKDRQQQAEDRKTIKALEKEVKGLKKELKREKKSTTSSGNNPAAAEGE